MVRSLACWWGTPQVSRARTSVVNMVLGFYLQVCDSLLVERDCLREFGCSYATFCCAAFASIVVLFLMHASFAPSHVRAARLHVATDPISLIL